jgi:hypothetical protein
MTITPNMKHIILFSKRVLIAVLLMGNTIGYIVRTFQYG